MAGVILGPTDYSTSQPNLGMCGCCGPPCPSQTIPLAINGGQEVEIPEQLYITPFSAYAASLPLLGAFNGNVGPNLHTEWPHTFPFTFSSTSGYWEGEFDLYLTATHVVNCDGGDFGVPLVCYRRQFFATIQLRMAATGDWSGYHEWRQIGPEDFTYWNDPNNCYGLGDLSFVNCGTSPWYRVALGFGLPFVPNGGECCMLGCPNFSGITGDGSWRGNGILPQAITSPTGSDCWADYYPHIPGNPPDANFPDFSPYFFPNCCFLFPFYREPVLNGVGIEFITRSCEDLCTEIAEWGWGTCLDDITAGEPTLDPFEFKPKILVPRTPIIKPPCGGCGKKTQPIRVVRARRK
jgi:hypothetical protein